MADLWGFRQYAVIRDNNNSDEVQLCLDATLAYAKGAAVPKPEGPSALYDMLIYRIATFYHDNRSFSGVDDAEFIGINGLILQLRDG